ncbi:IS1182 family transposase, partial [Planctomycetota bacterium]
SNPSLFKGKTMARYKHYDYNQMLLLPVCLPDQIKSGSFEWAIHTLIEEVVDLEQFSYKYRNDETGAKAYDPKLLLKIILLAYSYGITGSRRIERACRDNVMFMALACGQTPDHSTIAAFVSDLGLETLAALFQEILLICEEQNLLSNTHLSIDGVKLPGNASKHASGTIAELEAKTAKLEKKIKGLIQQHKRRDKKETTAKKARDNEDREDQDRINRLKRKAQQLKKFTRKNKPRIGRTGKEIKSNATDPESACMGTDHGVIQGYNAQATVDEKHQIIVHAEVFGNGQDGVHLGPMLAGAHETLKAVRKKEKPLKNVKVSADSSYHSKANLRACEEFEVDAYVPDHRFRKRDERFSAKKTYPEQKLAKRTKFTQDEFAYDPEQDAYICPAGKPLRLNARNHKRKGKRVNMYRSTEQQCGGCQCRKKCLWGKVGKYRTLVITIGHDEKNICHRMRDKIDTEAGKKIYEKRLGIVEPVFANIRHHKKLDRFTLRGKKKVDVQWMLYCLVHNIEKILHYGDPGICG